MVATAAQLNHIWNLIKTQYKGYLILYTVFSPHLRGQLFRKNLIRLSDWLTIMQEVPKLHTEKDSTNTMSCRHSDYN